MYHLFNPFSILRLPLSFIFVGRVGCKPCKVGWRGHVLVLGVLFSLISLTALFYRSILIGWYCLSNLDLYLLPTIPSCTTTIPLYSYTASALLGFGSRQSVGSMYGCIAPHYAILYPLQERERTRAGARLLPERDACIQERQGKSKMRRM